MSRAISALLLSVPLYAMALAVPYGPDFSGGVIPDEVSVTNGNSLLPDADGYKRGWTADGWTVDRYGNRGYVAISPTYTGSQQACANTLALPALEIGEDSFVSWQALSVHPDFPEAYRVEITADGTTETLFETAAEQSQWTTRMADIGAYAGKEAVISFVCTSCNRYMLALDGINVGTPEGLSVETCDLTPIYHGPAESTDIRLEALNTGASISGGSLLINANDGYSRSVPLDGEWLPGERRSFTLQAPLNLDAVTDYEVSLVPDDGADAVVLSKKSIYSSAFARTLLVDKGTGMWCVNCPEGILRMEGLERRFGSALIALDTHCTNGSPQSDPLANDEYFAELSFRSVPQFMLDRIRATASSDISKFDQYYYTPAEFGMEFSGLTLHGNDSAEISLTVASATATDNTDDHLRIGYVLTADIYDPENSTYHQRNNCTQPSSERFFYLPAKIPAPLCVFHNVTLSSSTAFSGIAGSLPAGMEAGGAYSYSFSIDRPEIVTDINNLRVAAFVLDTSTGRIAASAALRLGDSPSAALPSVTLTPEATVHADSNGVIHVHQTKATPYTIEVFNTAGTLCARFSGTSAEATHTLQCASGLYILRLCAGGNITSKKFIL